MLSYNPRQGRWRYNFTGSRFSSINQYKLNIGARDSSFMNKVSFLAKWLFSIKHGLHHLQNSRIHSVIRYSCKNKYPMLFVLSQLKITQLTELWLMITFTIYLSNQLTFSTMLLDHVLSLLFTAYSFKAYVLRITIHSIHAIDQFNSTQTQNF